MTSSTRSTARPSWDETWLSVARTVARRSLCSRDQVGAVIVSATNRLLETGYNGPPGGFETEDKPCLFWCSRAIRAAGDLKGNVLSDYSDCPALHAEMNALLRGDRIAREGGTIYVTSGMCMGCAKAVANSGLAMVVVDANTLIPPNAHKHRHADKSYEFLEQCGITVITNATK